MTRWLTTTLGVAGISLWASCLAAAEPPRVRELRTQTVRGITYFQVRLDRPADLRLPTFDTGKPFAEADRRKFATLPRLVPQDGKTRAVYYRHKPTQPGLSFCGLRTGSGKADFLLLYPAGEAPSDNTKPLSLSGLVRPRLVAEAPVRLDFASARVVPVPMIDPEDQHVHRDDLRSYWALHQAAYFAVLETQVLDFSFYSFAREATGRKYGVVAPAWVRRQTDEPQHRLYEITTGADALAETLQLHRLLRPEARPGSQRTVPLAEVAGVTVPEQPWGRLLEGKRPAREPLAHLVPHDNYYVHFKDLRKFLEFGELLDQWGTNLLRVYELKSRDYQLRERYEKQLCLRSTALGKVLGPSLVKGLAITGNDPYVREGSDVTVIFHVANRKLFLAAVEGFLQEARKEHGRRLTEGRDEYNGTTIERFVTPQREVSLHRAAVGDFVIYSNSPVGVRRVLDAHAARIKCLADADDFRYMRTVFPTGEKGEDGFVFLSDAFIRQLTGPASRIKEKRRLEALTSLYLLTNAALFGAWETGKLPADHAAVLAAAGLRPEDVAVPEGKGARWNGERQLAISDAYNTIHFATPLIELPIDKVTRAEAEEYGHFREEYSKLWRTYFDPVGLRLSLDARRVRVAMHILPLAGSDPYRSLQQFAGGGTVRFEPWPNSVVDFRLSVGGQNALSFYVGGNARLREMVELLIRWEEGGVANARQEYDRLFWKLPLGVGLAGPDAARMDIVDSIVNLLRGVQLLEGEPKVSTYRDAKLHRLPIDGTKYREVMAQLATAIALMQQQQQQQIPFASVLSLLPTEEAPAALNLAVIDKALHISADEALLKKLIDQAEARKKTPASSDREVNAALSIAASNAREAASLFLEYEGHCLALLNNQVWNGFYQAGVLAPDASETTRKETARRFLGFVPVSADASSYRYDARLGEVVNARHGSHRRPQLHDRVAEASGLGKLLDQIKALRAELRFLDNGLSTVVTIDRHVPR
jgi:hypothetical protein